MRSAFNISIASVLALAFLMLRYTSAQPPNIEWDGLYGGDSSDVACSVRETLNGRFIFAGWTYSFGAGEDDAYIASTDSAGSTVWTRTYGGTNYDEFYSLERTRDGCYVMAGLTTSFGIGSSDMYLLKIDDAGDTLWTHTYGGTGIDYARFVIQTPDGGFVLAGCSESFPGSFIDMYLVRTDSLGDTLWTRTYSGTDDRQAFCVRRTADGGYILVGYNPYYGGNEYDIYLVKTDSLGETLWTQTYGGNEHDRAFDVTQTSEGGYIIAGATESYGAGNEDVYVIKTDGLGDTLWTRTYGGAGGERVNSICPAGDGYYVLAGITASYGGGQGDLYLLKVDDRGDTLWTLVYGGSDNEGASSIDRTFDGGYIIAGSVSNFQLPADAWLVKTGPDTSSTHAPSIEWVSHPLDFALHPAYPNPFNPVTTISFDLRFQSKVSMNIYNVLGQRVAALMNGYALPGNHRLLWDATDLPSGIYFVTLQSGHSVQTRKVLFLK